MDYFLQRHIKRWDSMANISLRWFQVKYIFKTSQTHHTFIVNWSYLYHLRFSFKVSTIVSFSNVTGWTIWYYKLFDLIWALESPSEMSVQSLTTHSSSLCLNWTGPEAFIPWAFMHRQTLIYLQNKSRIQFEEVYPIYEWISIVPVFSFKMQTGVHDIGPSESFSCIFQLFTFISKNWFIL